MISHLKLFVWISEHIFFINLFYDDFFIKKKSLSSRVLISKTSTVERASNFIFDMQILPCSISGAHWNATEPRLDDVTRSFHISIIFLLTPLIRNVFLYFHITRQSPGDSSAPPGMLFGCLSDDHITLLTALPQADIWRLKLPLHTEAAYGVWFPPQDDTVHISGILAPIGERANASEVSPSFIYLFLMQISYTISNLRFALSIYCAHLSRYRNRKWVCARWPSHSVSI